MKYHLSWQIPADIKPVQSTISSRTYLLLFRYKCILTFDLKYVSHVWMQTVHHMGRKVFNIVPWMTHDRLQPGKMSLTHTCPLTHIFHSTNTNVLNMHMYMYAQCTWMCICVYVYVCACIPYTCTYLAVCMQKLVRLSFQLSFGEVVYPLLLTTTWVDQILTSYEEHTHSGCT